MTIIPCISFSSEIIKPAGSKAQVAVVVAGGKSTDAILDAVKKALSEVKITEVAIAKCSDPLSLPHATQVKLKTSELVIAVGLVPNDSTGVTSALVSSLLQVGTNASVPVVPGIFAAESLLEVKAVIPTLAAQWATAAAELLSISKGSIDAVPVFVLAPPPPPAAPVTAEVVNVSTLLDDFRATLKVS